MWQMPKRPLSLEERAAEARANAQRPQRRSPFDRTQYLERVASFNPNSSNLNAMTPDEENAIARGRDESARQAFIKQHVFDSNNEGTTESKARRVGSPWNDFFDSLRASEAAAAWEGKGFNVNFGSGGVTTNNTAMSKGSGGSMPRQQRAIEIGRAHV